MLRFIAVIPEPIGFELKRQLFSILALCYLRFLGRNNYACDEAIEIRLCCEKGKAYMSYDDARIEFNDGTVLSTKQGAGDIYYENGKDYWAFNIFAKSPISTTRWKRVESRKSAVKRHSKFKSLFAKFTIRVNFRINKLRFMA